MAIATGIAIAIAAVTASVVGTIAQGQAAKAQANFQAQVAQQQGERARQVAEVRARDFRKRTSAKIATVRAVQGDIQGSQLLALEDFTAEAEVSALTIRQAGVVQQTRLEQQAQLLQFSGKSAERSSFIRAGAQLLSGFSNTKFGGSGAGVTEAKIASQSFIAPGV